jgi:hypothetical protein
MLSMVQENLYFYIDYGIETNVQLENKSESDIHATLEKLQQPPSKVL